MSGHEETTDSNHHRTSNHVGLRAYTDRSKPDPTGGRLPQAGPWELRLQDGGDHRPSGAHQPWGQVARSGGYVLALQHDDNHYDYDNGGTAINKHDFFNKLHHDLHNFGRADDSDLDNLLDRPEHNHDDYGIPKYHHDCPGCRAEHGPAPRAAFRGDILDLVNEDLLD